MYKKCNVIHLCLPLKRKTNVMQNVVENKEMGIVLNVVFKFYWKNLHHCISLKESYTRKILP